MPHVMVDHPLSQSGRNRVLEEDPQLLTIDIVHSGGQEEPKNCESFQNEPSTHPAHNVSIPQMEGLMLVMILRG